MINYMCRKSILPKIIAIVLCFLLCFTLIPILDREGTAVNAEGASKIKLGDYVQMGTYYGQPIRWRCVAFYKVDANGNVDLSDTKTEYEEGYLPMMISDKIICLKAFDASGDVETGSHSRGYTYNNIKGYYRQKYGSNCWEDSNLRCWLNSTADAGKVEWICGNKPDAEHVWGGYNAYDQEAGFLSDNNFTKIERNCIKTVTQEELLDKYEYDDMSSYGNACHSFAYELANNKCVANFKDAYKKKVTDTMFLLDVNQASEVYKNDSFFNSSWYWYGVPTSQCVSNSGYQNSELKANKTWHYWLRTPCTYLDSNYSNCVRDIYLYAASYGVDAYYGDAGVRPAFYLNISTTNFVSGTGTSNDPYTVKGSPDVAIDYANEGTDIIIDSTVEYQKEGENTWTAGSGVKVGLIPGTTYKFRILGETQETTVVVPARPDTPTEPTVSSKTETTVNLNAVEGYEYKCDDGSWQDGTAFTGLTPGKSYKFYQRVKATESSFASDESLAATITVPDYSRIFGFVERLYYLLHF